jgi:hypothetical protein
MLSNCGVLAFTLCAAPALAQEYIPAASAGSSVVFTPPSQGGGGAAARTGKWEVEVHGGGAWDARSSSGTSTMPGAGTAFTTWNGFPSRRISTWYLGDGAALFNALPSGLRGGESIAPLDPALSATPSRKSGGAFGARVGYALTSRLTAEFSLDYNSGSLELDDETLAQVEASRTSFNEALTALTSAISVPTVSSTATIVNDQGSQLITVGTAMFKLMTAGRFVPYVVGGGGLISNLGDMPSVRLVGSYAFTSFGAPFTERDTLTVNYTLEDREFVGVVGGGVTMALAPSSGIRMDVRTHISTNGMRTSIDASPFVQTAVPPNALAATTVPSVQFANNPIVGSPSSLSGTALDDFETFKTSGWAQRVNVTAGYYFRF